ncbi:CsgG/HfaB family protein [Pantanalinema rosaneae CENA516]|uniref:CsgG/HfaB family protein n=1 Tax=Pantanalinema rosaneae TaxID=1620701 RepID=UPI003D6DCDD5
MLRFEWQDHLVRPNSLPPDRAIFPIVLTIMTRNQTMRKPSLLTTFTHLSLGLLLLIGAATPTLIPLFVSESAIAQPATKKKIAIVDFDFANTSDPSYWYAYRGGGASRGMSELLTNKLVNDGTFVITSRSALENYMRDHGISGNIDEATAVKIGKALGVDAVIVGSVTRFNVERKRAGGSFLGIGGSSEKTKAVVQVTARAIDTNSQNIIAAMEGLGEAETNSASGSIRGVSGGSSSSDTDEILSKAADDAVTKVVAQMKTKL